MVATIVQIELGPNRSHEVKSVENSNLERRPDSVAAPKRRYEAPRLVTETLDVRHTNKTNTSVIDIHAGVTTNSGS